MTSKNPHTNDAQQTRPAPKNHVKLFATIRARYPGTTTIWLDPEQEDALATDFRTLTVYSSQAYTRADPNEIGNVMGITIRKLASRTNEPIRMIDFDDEFFVINRPENTE